MDNFGKNDNELSIFTSLYISSLVNMDMFFKYEQMSFEAH